MNITRQIGPIGLDIGSQRIKAVQLVRRSKQWVAHATACFDRLEPGKALSQREAERIAEVLNRRGFAGGEVSLVAPVDGLIEAVLDVPPAGSNAPREQIVRMELARVHRMMPDSFEVACWSLPPNTHAGNSEQVVAAALPHTLARSLANPLGEAGLVVRSIEPAATALHRACKPMLAPMDHIGAIADLGSTGFRLTLVFAGTVVHQRNLPGAGAHALAQSLNNHVGGDEVLAEAALCQYGLSGSQGYDLGSVVCAEITPVMAELIEQIGMSFAYVSHQYPAAELGPLLLTGGAARMPGLLSAMSETLGLPTFTVSPSVQVHAGPGMSDDLDRPEATLAVGLAMTGGVA